MVEKKHLIIRNGATLRRLAEKPNNSFSPEKPLRNMEDSMDFLASEISKVLRIIELDNENDFLSELFLTFQMPHRFLAKSYEVESIYKKAGLVKVGTSDFKDRNHKVGRIDIVKGSKENIEKIIQIIQKTNCQIKCNTYNLFLNSGLVNQSLAGHP